MSGDDESPRRTAGLYYESDGWCFWGAILGEFPRRGAAAVRMMLIMRGCFGMMEFRLRGAVRMPLESGGAGAGPRAG